MMEYLERGYVLYAMLGIGILCILGKLIANGTYKRLIRQAENMASAKESFLKRLKLKYESTYRLNEGVSNVPAFVEKNLYQYKKMGISLRRLENLTIHGALICLLGGVCATLAAFWYQADIRITALQFAAGIIAGLALVLADSILDTGTKRDALLANICDYLENILVVRTSGSQEAEEEPTAARRKIKNDVFVRQQSHLQERGGHQGEQKESQKPEGTAAAKTIHETPAAAAGTSMASRKRENQSDMESLKKSLAQIAAVREEGGDGQKTRKKLSPKEEKLIADIIQEYLQ